MTSTLYTALTLLLIGMITVFVVLSLVVITGNVLIRIVNRFFPVLSDKTGLSELSPEKISAITAAIEIITEGRGKVKSIEKKDK